MIKTWTANIMPLYENACYQKYYQCAPGFRREKADKLQSCQAKAQSIGVWSLYDRMRKEYGFGEDAVYNFSHSGEYVLCSVSVNSRDQKIRVGCDIEKIKSCNLKIARRFFCPSEYERIAGEADEAERTNLFYRYWVLKESFMKATRQGMALGMDTFEIRLGDPSVLIRQPEAFPELYTYREFETNDKGYKIAVCSTDEAIDSMIQMEFEV